MTTPKTPARLDAEVRKARMRYQDRGAFAGSSEAAQQACWEEAVRPLVEEIERLRSEPQAHDLTSSDVALAKMLSAAIDWLRPGHDDDSREANAIRRACAPFVDLGLMYAGTGQATETGRTLLDRARKAGVL